MSEKFRSRNFAAVLYPEDETHVEAMSRLMKGGYKFAAILHDRDWYDSDDKEGTTHESDETETQEPTPEPSQEPTPEERKQKKQHWHICLSFPSARWNVAVAEELGIAENYLQKCSSVDGSLIYMTHYQLPAKAQYDKSEVFGHKTLLERLDKLLSGESESQRVRKLLSLIDETPGHLDPADVLGIACDNELYDVLRRCPSWIMQDVLFKHNLKLSGGVE